MYVRKTKFYKRQVMTNLPYGKIFKYNIVFFYFAGILQHKKLMVFCTYTI